MQIDIDAVVNESIKSNEILEKANPMDVETGKLTPDVDNIDFEDITSEKDCDLVGSPLVQKHKDDIVFPEILESDVGSEADASKDPNDIPDSQKSSSDRDFIVRQDTLVSISEIDMPSSEPRMSEGEILLNQPEVSSDGEISFGAVQTDQTRSDIAGDISSNKSGKISDKSEGECSVKNNPNESSGVEEYLGDYSTSEGELGEKLPRRKTNPIRSDLTRRVLESSGSTSSFSEGEWRASPARMRRFLNMASAFRMMEKKD